MLLYFIKGFISFVLNVKQSNVAIQSLLRNILMVTFNNITQFVNLYYNRNIEIVFLCYIKKDINS